MKTIKEVADELGYSKTYISQTIKKLGLKSSLRKNGNKFMIPDELESFIKKALEEESQTEEHKQNENNSQTDLRFKIEVLREQLAIKDKQISDLGRLLDQQQQLLLNEQHKNQLLLEKSVKIEKRRFWSRFFRLDSEN